MSGTDLTGAPIDVRDPLAERLKALSDAADSPEDKVAALLGLREVFPPELAPLLKAPVAAAYALLDEAGVHKAMEVAIR
jgi:fructuronate reductase